jgi:ABC-type Fe3+/spermidine/putrescine transport system ATPase subunit
MAVDNTVVQNLDLTIARGEFLTLLGPSGSGKTTTLLMLPGFEPRTAGPPIAAMPAPTSFLVLPKATTSLAD